jgi:hypothetical protein
LRRLGEMGEKFPIPDAALESFGRKHPNVELDERQRTYIIDSREHVKLEGRHG